MTTLVLSALSITTGTSQQGANDWFYYYTKHKSMKKILFLSLVLFLSITFSYTQHNIELKEGIFYTNYFRSSQNTDSFWGWGNKTEITYGFDFWSHKNSSLSLGLGYAYFNYIDDHFLFNLESNRRPSRSYFTLLAMYNLNITRNISVHTALMQYFMLEKKYDFGLHKKIFINLDIGVGFKITKKLSLTISSPISLVPMYSGQVGVNGSGPFPVTGEQIGLDIGLKYSF